MIKLNEIGLDKTIEVLHCDLDGIQPYIISKFFNINFAKSISTNYGELLELEPIKTENYKNVIYVDFTPSVEVRKIIEEKQMNVLILDLHESVHDEIVEWCKIYPKAEYIFDDNRCGTKIYYDYLMENGYKNKTNSVVEQIVNLVNIYDLYKQDNELWETAFRLNTLLYCTGKYWEKDDRFKCYEFFINNILWKMQNADHFFFNSLEESKINADIAKSNKIFEDLVKNASKEISTRKDSRGNYFAVFNCKSKISDVCNKLLKRYKKLKYVICINKYDVENPRVSLRCLDDFDLTELMYVKGHKCASGISDELVDNMKDFVKKLENKEIYELGYRN